MLRRIGWIVLGALAGACLALLGGCVSHQSSKGTEVIGFGYIHNGEYQTERAVGYSGNVSDAVRRP